MKVHSLDIQPYYYNKVAYKHIYINIYTPQDTYTWYGYYEKLKLDLGMIIGANILKEGKVNKYT